MKRYDLDGYAVGMAESRDGEWVRYNDVLDLITEHRRKMDALNACVDETLAKAFAAIAKAKGEQL